MSDNTNIEWADSTFNPWIGCTKVSPGCDHCYAEQLMDKRMRVAQWGPGQPRVRTGATKWRKPIQWNNAHAEFFAEHGRRRRVFCASLADVFDNEVPQEWRDDLFQLIAATPNLDWLLLTKRIGNVGNMLPVPFDFDRLYPNVWIGATICTQEEADRDIPKLLAVPAAVRFLSMEPLLGPVDLQRPCTARCPNRVCWASVGHLNERLVRDSESGGFVVECICSRLNGLHWVIAGGESGPNARPMHPDWARSLRDQCAAAGVPFLFKQWGEWLPWTQFGDAGVDDPPEQTRFQTRELVDGEWHDVGMPDVWASKDGLIDDMQCVGRVGKAVAGRLLDGVQHDGYPEAA